MTQTLFLAEYLTPMEKLETFSSIHKNILTLPAPDFLRAEIYKHYPRLSEISGMTVEQVREAEFQICQDITFISEEQIKESIWMAAEKLVADIDPKDTHYIAYSKHFRCKIWSGDKRLIKGLAKKGVANFISTDELFSLRQP